MSLAGEDILGVKLSLGLGGVRVLVLFQVTVSSVWKDVSLSGRVGGTASSGSQDPS